MKFAGKISLFKMVLCNQDSVAMTIFGWRVSSDSRLALML